MANISYQVIHEQAPDHQTQFYGYDGDLPNGFIDNLNDKIEAGASAIGNIAKKYFGHLRDDHQYQTDKAFRYIRDHVKPLLNIVEDRRIDNFIFKSAPGYKGYYHALYEKYFNAKIIDKGLMSSEKRDLDWDSYMFRI